MKKLHLWSFVFLFCIMNAFPALIAAADQPIIIDHTCTDIWQIPESAIEQAKTALHIAYGHTSHGSQLTSGMGSSGTQLDTFMSANGAPSGLYVWHDGPQAGALDLDNYFVSGDLGNPDRVTWAQRTRDYLDNPDNADVNVVIWSWCGQVDGSETDINTYLSLMNQLEIDYPDVTFVYMTGHLDGSGETGNVHVRNNQIRDFCIANNKVLYDFADIESYDPEGLVNYMALSANDNCDYDSDANGSRDANWATDWQNSHVEGIDWWASGAAHSQHLNGNRKGYAAWWLWATLAGWNPCIPAPSNLSADANSETQTMELSWNDNSQDVNEDLFVIQRRINDGDWDNGYATVPRDTTFFQDTSLDPGIYSYRVVAYVSDNGDGDACYSPASNTASGDIASVEPPTDLIATGDSITGTVALSWTDMSGNEDEFIIQRRVDGGTWDNGYDSVGANITSYLDDNNGLPPLQNGTYTYRIVSSNTQGASTPSNEAQAVIASSAPDAPSNLDSTLSGFDMTLTWSDNSDNEERFILERKTDDNEFAVIDDAIPANTESTVDPGLQPLHTYTYRITAANNFGESDPSNETGQYMAEESFSITLKQGVNGYTGCSDAYLESANPSLNYGSDPYNYVNNSPKTNFLAAFDMPPELSGKKILEATIGFYCWSVSSHTAGQYLDLYKINAYWEEGTADGAYQEGSVSWNVRAGNPGEEIPWTTPGGDVDGQLLGSSLIPSSGYYPEFDITDLVQEWVDGTTDNFGVMLKNDSSVGTGIKASEYSEYGRPYLHITYTSTTDCTLSTASSEGGSVSTPGEGSFAYGCGSVVALIASPNEGYAFLNWTGDVLDPDSAATSIIMDTNKDVTANFVPVIPTCSLSILSTDGGSVTTPGEGLFSYDCGATVGLVATPLAGFEFVNWTGNVSDPDSMSTSIHMDADQSVTANFAELALTYELTTASTAGGEVTAPGEGIFSYEAGTDVTVTATPGDGFEFVSWTGDVNNPDAATTSVVMNADKQVTANFSAIVQTFTLTAGSTAGGSVTLPGEGSFPYEEGDQVELAATPLDGYTFVNWSGGVDNPDSETTTITMDSDKTITANFAATGTPALVAHYKFDDNYTDSSGNENHGVNNGAVIAAGKIDQAAKFDGITDYVSADDSESLDLTGEITLSAWIYYEDQNDRYPTIISKMNHGTNWSYSCFALGVWSNHVRYGTDGGGKLSEQVLEPGNWYHLVMTHSDGLSRLYVNGSLDSSATDTFIRTSDQPLAIGARKYNTQRLGEYTGLIDDVRVYGQAISEDQILGLYEQSPVSPVSNFQIATGSGQLTLSWNNPSDPDFTGVLITRTTGPENNVSYEVGSIICENVVVYKGSESSFIDTGLIDGKVYLYQVFAFNADGIYSSSVIAGASPENP